MKKLVADRVGGLLPQAECMQQEPATVLFPLRSLDTPFAERWAKSLPNLTPHHDGDGALCAPRQNEQVILRRTDPAGQRNLELWNRQDWGELPQRDFIGLLKCLCDFRRKSLLRRRLPAVRQGSSRVAGLPMLVRIGQQFLPIVRARRECQDAGHVPPAKI